MRVINYFDSDRQSHWLNEIKRGDWGAAGFLYELLSKGTFFDAVGENSKVLLLTDGDELISLYRGKGYGKRMMEHWEQDMQSIGYGMIMTSTQVDEDAQHFYRKLGYKDCGGFVVDIPGYEQPMEMIMIKELTV